MFGSTSFERRFGRALGGDGVRPPPTGSACATGTPPGSSAISSSTGRNPACASAWASWGYWEGLSHRQEWGYRLVA
eukprot:5539509-Lingulodinium_polyedra.AAC.1